MRTQIKYEVIYRHRDRYAISTMCRFFEVSRSGYYDFVNSCRLAEFKLLIEKGAHTKYTLNALIEMCGFNSRTSFFRYFKKINGIYPSEYIKTFEKQN